MKSSRRELLVAALLVASASPVLFPGCFGWHAVVLASENRGDSEIPGLEYEHSSKAMARGQATIISKATGSVALGPEPVRISLARSATPDRSSLGARLDKLEPGRRIYLVLRGLSTTEQPGVLYHLYLDLPADAKPAKNDLRYAGSLNFFDVAKPGAPRSERASIRSYDITDVAMNLKARRLLSDESTITISPAGPPAAEARPIIGGVEIVEQ